MKIYYIANIRLPTEKAHGVQILKACEGFVLAGQDVTLLVPERKNQITEDPFSYYGIKTNFTIRKLKAFDSVGRGRFGFLLHTVSFALSVARHLDPEVILYGRDELLLSIVGFFCNNKLFWETHDGRWNMFVRYLKRRVQGMVAVTQGAKEFYISKGISAAKLLAIPNGIDLDEFPKAESPLDVRRRLHIPAEARVAMYIGALDGWKGVGTLLEASLLLPDVRTVIIGGDDHQVAALRERYPHVLFLGFRPYAELANNQAAADILVVPNTGKDPVSRYFTSPLKLLAHMASGVPIVASDLPSIRELVGEDAAWLVQPDDSEALAEGITVMLDVMRGRPLARRARERVKHFDWKSRAQRIVLFIQEHI